MRYTVEVTKNNTYWYKEETTTLHREDGPALERANGDKAWYKEGKCHREDGPAIEYADGYKAWYKEGKLHREDGPAIEWDNAYKTWHLEGKEYTEVEYNKQMNKSVTCEGKVIEIDGKKYKLTSV